MSRIMNPGRGNQESLLDVVAKGLNIAQSVYGIRVDSQKLEDAKSKEEETKAEKARLASGRLNKGEQIELGAKGLAEVAPGTAGAFSFTDSESGLTKWVGKQNAPAIKPPDERLAFDREKFEYTKTKDKRDAAERAQTQAVSAGRKKGGGPNPDAPYEQRLASLNGEERKRLDSASMGLNAVQGMTAALKGGSNTFSLIGDNDFTLARRNFEEALGRMQSGGAINSEEAARFAKMAPGPMDSAEMQEKKLNELAVEMSLRIQNLGFKPEEIVGARQAIAGTSAPAQATPDINSLGLPGNKTSATAAPGQAAAGSIVEISGKRYQVGADGDTLTELK